MSDPHRPFGVPDHSDDHDPHRVAKADASRDDADALDAWLNGIVSHGGSPGTRSGSGHDRPDARTDDAAFVMETAARFHHRIAAAQARDARAAGPDPQLWETIMERTSTPKATPGAATTANPCVAQGDTTTSPSRRKRSTPNHGAMRRQQVWNTIANIALVAAILLAGLGIWRLSGEPGLPGGSDNAPETSQLAMQPATPEATPGTVEAPATVDQPVATPAPTTDCDFSADIPIFNGVDESPWGGTAVLLTTDGDVVLTCPEEPEPTVLASDADGISPLGWPGTVLAHDYDDSGAAGESPIRAINLIAGDVIEFGTARAESMQDGPSSPWVVGPAPDDPSDIQILDLRTMETRLLSDIAGMALPKHGGYLLSNGGGTLVLSLTKQQQATQGEATLITDGLPGDLLALDGNFTTASWVSPPDGFPPVVNFDVAPDGKHVALHGAKGPYKDREHTFSVVRLSEGKEVIRSLPFGGGLAFPGGSWVEGGEALAYIADGAELVLLPVDPDMSEQTMFHGDGPLTNLRATTDDSILLVNKEWSEELATVAPGSQQRTLYAVDVDSGEAATFSGVDISHNTNPWPHPERFLVTFEYTTDLSDTITYQVIDAVTGEAVDTLDDVPVNAPQSTGYPFLGLRSVVSSADGETEVIAFDSHHIYLMQIVDDEPQVRQIAPPPGVMTEFAMQVSMFISPDGSLLSLTGENDESQTRWLLPLDGGTGEWTEVPTTVVSEAPRYIFFVPGTDA